MPDEGRATDTFLTKQSWRIPGFLEDYDARAIAGFARGQAQRGITGGLVEIGVYSGKLLLLLATLRCPHEAVLGIDLFLGDEEERRRPADSPFASETAAFAHRFGIMFDEARELLKVDSTSIAPDDILARTGSVRIFSVDGGHDHATVASDLALADAVVGPQGLIIIDDFFNQFWPGVTTAALDFLARPDAPFVPVLLSAAKLYVCRREAAPAYRAQIASDPAFSADYCETRDMLGHPLVTRREAPSGLAKWQGRLTRLLRRLHPPL